MNVKNWPRDYRSTVSSGVRGRTRIEEFTVDAVAASKERMYAGISWSSGGLAVPEGTYRKLVVNGVFMASDTPDEQRDMRGILSSARGDVLIGGLGLGWLVELLLSRPMNKYHSPITSLTVIEISPDVIALVESHLKSLPGGERVTIVEADVLDWNPRGARYTCAWWDIWPTLCTSYRPEYEKLFRRWGRRVEFQDAWCKDYVYNRGR